MFVEQGARTEHRAVVGEKTSGEAHRAADDVNQGDRCDAARGPDQAADPTAGPNPMSVRFTPARYPIHTISTLPITPVGTYQRWATYGEWFQDVDDDQHPRTTRSRVTELRARRGDGPDRSVTPHWLSCRCKASRGALQLFCLNTVGRPREFAQPQGSTRSPSSRCRREGRRPMR